MANVVTITVDMKDLASDDIKRINTLMRNQSKATGAAVAKSNSKIKSSFKGVGGQLKMLAGAAGFAGLAYSIVQVGKAAFSMSMSLETAFAEVMTISDEARLNSKALKDELLTLSTEVPQSAVELTKGLYQAISSGVTDTTQAMQLLNVASRAAVGGLTNTETAINATTNVMNAYGMSVDKASRINDILFTTVKEGKVRYEELASSIGGMAPTAALLGIRFEEISAAMATMTKTGVSFEEASTQIRNVMLQIVSPTDDARKAARKYGIELSSVGIKAAGGLVPFLGQVNEKIGQNIDAMQAMFPEMRAFRGAAVLAGVQFEEFNRILGETEKGVDNSVKAFNIMADTTENRLKKANDSIMVTLSRYADLVIPSLIAGYELIAKMFTRVTFGRDGVVEKTDKLVVSTDKVVVSTDKVRTNSEAVGDALRAVEERMKIVAPMFTGVALSSEKFAFNMRNVARDIPITGMQEMNSNLQLIDISSESVDQKIGRWGQNLSKAVNYANQIQKSFEGIGDDISKLLSGKGSFRTVLNLLGRGANLATVGGGLFGLGKKLFGFEHGGSFTVPGSGMPDSKLVAFKASPGEKVNVSRPGFGDDGGSNTFNVTMPIYTYAVNRETIESQVIPALNRYAKNTARRR